MIENMSEDTQLKVDSPCISVCAMDDLSGFCLGCYRTVDEIKTWWDMGPDEQKNLLVLLDERQLEQANFD